MRHSLTQIGLLLALGIVAPSMATTIDFEAQAAARGGSLTGIPDSPLTIGIATFTGGELLNAEVGVNTDQTGVYATEGLFGSGETNPLVIQFSAPVADFSILIANGDDVRKYAVSDNLGSSVTMSLASAGALGAATFSLPGGGLRTVDITSANANAWDFAIDNVTFFAATSTPEPASLLPLSAGLVLVAGFRRKELSVVFRK